MYCYAYIVHSAACFKGRQNLMTSSLAQSPMAIPVLSSVAECAKSYSDCLTTRQRCGLRLRKGSLWRVGSACSGTDSVIRVLEHIGRSSGWVFKHTFSCECDGANQTWLQENFPRGAPGLRRHLRVAHRPGIEHPYWRGKRRPGCGLVCGRLRVQVRVHGNTQRQ